MLIRSLLLALGVAALSGCSSQQSATETPGNHPANPTAAEGPAPEPSRTLQDQATSPAQHPRGGQADTAATIYTCPHHPEVTSNQPGVCPKCDMKLQPKKQSPTSGSPSNAGGSSSSHQGHGGHGGHQ